MQVLGGSGRVRQGLCSLRGPGRWEEGGAGEARKLERGARTRPQKVKCRTEGGPELMPSVGECVGRELSKRDSCLLCPCCRGRCLPAGLLACLGHLRALDQWSPSGLCGCPGGCERNHGEWEAELEVQFYLCPPPSSKGVFLCVFNDVHKIKKAMHGCNDKHAHGDVMHSHDFGAH